MSTAVFNIGMDSKDTIKEIRETHQIHRQRSTEKTFCGIQAYIPYHVETPLCMFLWSVASQSVLLDPIPATVKLQEGSEIPVLCNCYCKG